MKLKIDKFAKIKEADIDLNGITVIAGHNDTGKSTIGKVLYSIFNSFYQIDKKVSYQRKHDIEDICEEITKSIYNYGNLFSSDDQYANAWMNTSDILAQKILEYKGEMSIDAYKEIFKNEFRDEDDLAMDDYAESSYVKISAIKNTSDVELYKEISQRLFSNVFLAQMNNCYYPTSDADVSLTIKDKEIKILFENNECKMIELPINILHEAFFIDDPFVLDSVGYRRNAFGMSMRNQLIRRLNYPRQNILDGIFDAVTSKENLKEINAVLSSVVNGEVRNSKDGLEYISNGREEAIAVSNLSAGLKGFILIKSLLEKGILKEKDILILDEPEVHMHTQWQLVYAEIIVLLQKCFSMTILVTTHSSHFLQAIEYYSKKYKLQDRCSYYLSKKSEDGVEFENVTEDTSRIYSQMVEPSILLDRLEEELEYEREDEIR